MTKTKHLIFLTGYAGAGKDTFCEYIAVRLFHANIGSIRVAFADSLKEVACKLFTLPLPLFTDPQFKDEIIPQFYSGHPFTFGKTPRELLQFFGTEIVRTHMDQDFWVKAAWPQINFIVNQCEYNICIITDVRFSNEVILTAGFFKNMQSTLIRIERPGIGPANSHISEKPVSAPGINTIVFNAPDHESPEYALEADKILKQIGVL